MITRVASRSLVAVGLALVGLNVAGLFLSLRNDAIYDEPVPGGGPYTTRPSTFREVVTLDQGQLLAATARLPGEGDGMYTARLTRMVHRGIAHYWDDAGIDRYHLRVPAHENYLLFIASLVKPSHFLKYEYYDHRKAIERGVGWCSQQATILARVLEEERIETRIVLFPRHTVVVARVDKAADTWWIADPDYGVVIRSSLADIERDPGRILSSYVQGGFTPEQVEAQLIPAYSEPYREVDGAGGYHRLRKYYEPAAYALIWVVPAVLLLAGAWLRPVQRRQQAEVALNA